ncbi:MAG: TolC family protein [Sphingobacterium sp.]|nr:TolC family protein [Sphingobacterium sp.]
MLDGLIDEALKNNPEIQASQARIEAARLRIPQAGSLPDPMFMFGYQNESFRPLYLRRDAGLPVDVFGDAAVSFSGQAQRSKKK